MHNIKILLLNIFIFLINSSFCLAAEQTIDFKNPVTNSDNLIQTITKDNSAKDKDKNPSLSIFKESYLPVEQYKTNAESNIHNKVIKPDGVNLSEEGKLILDSVFLDSRFTRENNPHNAKILKFHKAMLTPQQLVDKATYKQIINRNYGNDLKVDCIKFIGKDFESSLGFSLPIGP